MMVKTLLSTTALLAAANAAALDARQTKNCRSGNDAIDVLIQSTEIIRALCSSVVVLAPPSTVTVATTSSSQYTVLATQTDTAVRTVTAPADTVFVTTTSVRTSTTREVVTVTGAGSPPTTSNNPPPTTVTTTTSTSTTGAGTAPSNAVPSCDAVGYAGNTPAYYFDSSASNSNFAGCSALCKADSTCQSFGYGSGNCLLFNVPTTNNVNVVAGSPYRFFNRDCSAPVVSRSEIALKQLIARQFGTDGSWGTVVGGPVGQGGVIQQLTEVCKCLFSTGGTVTVTQTYTQIATITRAARVTVTRDVTVGSQVTQTRRVITTTLVTERSSITVGPPAQPTTTTTQQQLPSQPTTTFGGGVGI